MRLPTRGGAVTIATATGDRCCTCDAELAALSDGVGLVVETRAPTLTVPALCGDCVSEALALFFGRRHVQHGGNVNDLHVPDHEPVDDPQPPAA